MSDKEGSIETADSPHAVVQDIYALHYDSDEDPSTGGDKYNRLHWNIDPISSFSDWNIELSVLEDGVEIESRTYHVHKSILAVGTRRSEYFAQIFYNDNLINDFTSKVHLEKAVAHVFPALLDYLYFPERPLKVLCRETVVALHYLGNHFGMQQLIRDAKHLLKKDLTIENCLTYYRQAIVVKDAKVQEVVSKMCAANVDEIFPSSAIIQVYEPNLWLQVLETYPKHEYAKCCHVSRLMAAFCENNYSELDAAMLDKIVVKVNLPHIPLDAGISFINIENRLLRRDENSSQQKLTDIQKRMIVDCFASRWSNVGMKDASFSSFLKDQSPLFLSELMVQLIDQAQSKVMSLEKEKTEMLNKMSKCSFCFEKAKKYHR